MENDTGQRQPAVQEHNGNPIFLQSLIDYLPLLIFARSAKPADRGQIVVWNKAAEIITGFPAERVIGKTASEAFPARLAGMADKLGQGMLANPMVRSFPELPLERADGGLRYLRLIAVPLLDDDGNPEYILGIAEDITSRRQEQLELRSKQAELAAANDASPLGLFRTDAAGRCTYVNRTYEQMSGLTRGQVLGHGWAQAIHPEDRLKIFQGWGQSSRNREPYQGIYRFRHPDGRIVWISAKAAPIVVDGRIEGYVGSVDDITARRTAEQALRDSEAHLRTIADALPAMIAYIDTEQHYRFNNLAYERAYRMQRDAMRGMQMRELLGEQEYRRVAPFIERALGGERLTFELEYEGNGAYRCDETTCIPQLSGDGATVIGLHLMTQDISAKKLEERRLVHLARVDILTGVVNRAGFEKKLSDAMAHSRTGAALMALMYMDLDRFKQINDLNGHLVGDELLKAFAARLSQAMRASDTIARLGGDEFTIIMENLAKPEDAAAAAAKIVQMMRSPFILNGKAASITVSIGLAYYRGAALDPAALVKQADQLLYAAKEAGRNTFRAGRAPG